MNYVWLLWLSFFLLGPPHSHAAPPPSPEWEDKREDRRFNLGLGVGGIVKDVVKDVSDKIDKGEQRKLEWGKENNRHKEAWENISIKKAEMSLQVNQFEHQTKMEKQKWDEESRKGQRAEMKEDYKAAQDEWDHVVNSPGIFDRDRFQWLRRLEKAETPPNSPIVSRLEPEITSPRPIELLGEAQPLTPDAKQETQRTPWVPSPIPDPQRTHLAPPNELQIPRASELSVPPQNLQPIKKEMCWIGPAVAVGATITILVVGAVNLWNMLRNLESKGEISER
jgi:hypothetical protein